MLVDGACRSLKLDAIVTIQQRNLRASSERSNCSGLDVEKQSRSPVKAEREDDVSRKNASESTDPLAGRLGAAVWEHSEGIAYKPLCGEVAMCWRVGGWGQ